MTLQELLNSQMDFASISAALRQGLAWWLDELTAMLPDAWRERLSSRQRLWIEPDAAGGWRLWKDGRLIEAEAGAAQNRIGLLAPPDAVLTRETSVPRMSSADVRRLLSVDIDRLSPLAPELIHFDMEIIDRGEDDGQQRVLLGILPRAEAARLLHRAREDGFAPVAMAVRAMDDDRPPRFDFLPQVLEAVGEPAKDRGRRYLWVAAAALIVANIALMVGRDVMDVSRLRATVDAQRPVVDAVLRLRRRVEGDDAQRRDLLARGRRGDPLRMLDALTVALPAGAWVQHLEWNGQTLRIVGFKREDIDIASVIRASGAFTNPRVSTAEPTSGPTPIRAFDVTADARPEQRP